MNTPVPESWGNDTLSKFMADAYHNCMASFVNYRKLPIMTAVREIDACFRCALGISFKPIREIFVPSFVGRCHAAYLSGIQLSMAGQVPEAYPLIRLCIENALYALFIQDDPVVDDNIPERWKIWLDRDTNEEAEKKCRSTFAYGRLRNHLVTRDAALGECAGTLYQRTIKYGAHPNFYGQAQASVFSEEGGNVQYLLPNTMASKVCMQTVVHAGICVLKIFALSYRTGTKKRGFPPGSISLTGPRRSDGGAVSASGGTNGGAVLLPPKSAETGRLPRFAPKKIGFAAGGKNGSKCGKYRDLRTNPYESQFSSTYPPRSGFATRNDMSADKDKGPHGLKPILRPRLPAGTRKAINASAGTVPATVEKVKHPAGQKFFIPSRTRSCAILRRPARTEFRHDSCNTAPR